MHLYIGQSSTYLGLLRVAKASAHRVKYQPTILSLSKTTISKLRMTTHDYKYGQVSIDHYLIRISVFFQPTGVTLSFILY